MKRLIFFFALILILCTSCKKDVEVTFAEEDALAIYAIEEQTSLLKKVEVEYKIENEKDLFYLYTSYQNYLPLGYTSPANPNISLLDCWLKNKIVYYTVDNFILLSDIQLFHDALLKTGECLNLREVHIILNQKQLI